MRIIVLESSALHLGFVGCYGNDWVATPNLDRLAAEGVVFDQHIADTPRPVGCAATQERDPPDNCIHRETIVDLSRFKRQVVTLLRRNDRPVLWVDGPSLAPPWRLPTELLQVYADEEAEDEEPRADPPRGIMELDFEELDRLQTTYAAVVTHYDALLGHILDHLRETGRLDDVLLCVTARYGLPLGEHDLVGVERPWLHDELIHVPLILRFPGAADAGLRIPALTQPMDLLPTLRDFLSLAPADVPGYSLLPLIRGDLEQVRPYAVSIWCVAGSEEWALRTPERALLLPIQVPEGDPARGPQLYAKPEDRWEANDLSPRSEEEVQRLRQTLQAFADASRQPGPLVYPPLPDETPVVAEEAS